MIDAQVFNERLDSVKDRINQACQICGRSVAEVTLMAVTKNHPATAAELAAEAGLAVVGENRVQEAAEKRPVTRFPIRWELIGHLQSNKARLALSTFNRIQSVDSIKLINVLRRLIAEGTVTPPYPILLQVNAGNDPGKFGCSLNEVDNLLEAALAGPELRVDGLMTIAPLDALGEAARPTFANLRQVRDRLSQSFGLPLTVLSMGMTGDLEPAIAEGSTMIRVGTALYGSRS